MITGRDIQQDVTLFYCKFQNHTLYNKKTVNDFHIAAIYCNFAKIF